MTTPMKIFHDSHSMLGVGDAAILSTLTVVSRRRTKEPFTTREPWNELSRRDIAEWKEGAMLKIKPVDLCEMHRMMSKKHSGSIIENTYI
jgi:hypothetical protein